MCVYMFCLIVPKKKVVMVVVVVFQAETIAKTNNCNFMLTLHILFDVLFCQAQTYT